MLFLFAVPELAPLALNLRSASSDKHIPLNLEMAVEMSQSPPPRQTRQAGFAQRAYRAVVVQPLAPYSLWVKLLAGAALAIIPGLVLAIGALLEAGVLATHSPQLLLEVTGAFLVVVLVEAVGAYYVAGQIVAPIEAIIETAKTWESGDLSKHIEVDSTSPEFVALVGTLNSVAVAVQQSRERIREADLRLRLESERLRAILNTSPAGTLVMGSDESIKLSNPASDALLGETFRPDVPLWQYDITSHLYRADGQPYRYEDLPIVQSLRSGLVVTGVEVIVRRPNGWELHLLTNSAPIRNGRGQITGSVAAFFDVSALAEEERLRNEFVVSASHEFRQPLTVIKGYAEVAMRDPSIRNSQVCQELARILNAADRVERLADELQHAAQMHLTPITLHKEVVNLGKLAEDVVRGHREVDPSHVYEITVKTPPVIVEGDPTLLREALDDLLRHAAAASPVDSTIEVRVWAWDGVSNLSVTDHGPSVAAEAVPVLFNPFLPLATQQDTQQRPVLLLYLAKRIVEESGGWIRGESSPQGTTITVTLPRCTPSGATYPMTSSDGQPAPPALHSHQAVPTLSPDAGRNEGGGG